MSFTKFIKLVVGILFVAVICFGLVVYENNYIASVGAHSASIELPSYNVGTEYNGLVSKQYVTLGSTVKNGQKLFEIKSDQLSADLSDGSLTKNNLTYQMASDGGFIITATQSGVVSQINALQGSFVNAGSSLATITGTSGASVRADFELSGPEYAKVDPETTMQVALGGTTYRTTITGITQQSVNGRTYTIVDANLPNLSKTQTVYSNGTPAVAKLVLNNHTLYDKLMADARNQQLIHV